MTHLLFQLRLANVYQLLDRCPSYRSHGAYRFSLDSLLPFPHSLPPSPSPSPGGKRGALSKVASFLNSTVAPPVLLALAGFLWFQVLVVYTRKNWHYRMGLLAGDAWLG